MVKYRRLKIPGGVFFFTVTLHNRNASYLTQHIHSLTNAFRITRNQLPFKTIAMVVLPDHIHAIWKLPDNDDNYSLRWMEIKRRFTQSLLNNGSTFKTNHRRESMLWQRRFWEHAIRNDKDYEQHVNYIHYNPVKHGLVEKVKEWPYSTFHQYVRQGILPPSWGELEGVGSLNAGERS